MCCKRIKINNKINEENINIILVTGAACFIASHIIEELIKNQYNTIVGIDNFYSGTKENIEYIKSSDKNDQFTFIEADIRDFEKVNQIIKEYKIT